MVSESEEVWVKVIAVDVEAQKISLSMKYVDQASGKDMDPYQVDMYSLKLICRTKMAESRPEKTWLCSIIRCLSISSILCELIASCAARNLSPADFSCQVALTADKEKQEARGKRGGPGD